MHMHKLIDHEPKRIFTFGCSFTRYYWATWANILGAEFPNAKFYNLGRWSAGNTYIHNILIQADIVYKFNKNDLVIVEWTSPFRFDRYLKDGWVTTGNIHTQTVFPNIDFETFSSTYGSYVEDLALIQSAYKAFKGTTQFHMIKMTSFNKKDYKIIDLYKDVCQQIHPSFFEVLWNDDIEIKYKKDEKLIHRDFKNGHPFPSEHFEYLKKTFDHNWSNNTINEVNKCNSKLIELLKDATVKGHINNNRSDGKLPTFLKSMNLHKRIGVEETYHIRLQNRFNKRIHRA